MSFRYALQTYIDNPSHPSVVFHDANVVIIKDQYPKACGHLLVLPRSKQVTLVHPLDAFHRDYDDFSALELYDMMDGYVQKAKELMKQELSQVFPSADLHDFIKAGVHSIPSMSNLHIHVISKDFYSARLKNKKHFNSFNTSFFVDFDKLNPLLSSSYRRRYSSANDYDSDSHSQSSDEESVSLERNPKRLDEIIAKTPLKCPQCGRSFQFSMVKLKAHLEQEYHKKVSG